LKASHKKKTVSILGFGWLGAALYDELKNKGYEVTAFSRSIASKTSDHSKQKFELGQDDFPYGSLGTSLIFTLPPKAVIDCYGAFKSFITQLPKNVHLIYISSTSVFGATQGLCTEKVTPSPDNDRGKRQKELEDFILSANEMATIVRAGGLIGDDRFPAVPEGHLFPPADMVNLIDKIDIVSILSGIVEENIKPSLVHAVAPFHPLKNDYYLASSKVHLQNQLPKTGKIVFSDYLNQTGYKFQNPSLKHPQAGKGHKGQGHRQLTSFVETQTKKAPKRSF